MTDFNVNGNLTVLQGALLRGNVFVASDADMGPTAVQGSLLVSGSTDFQNSLTIHGPTTASRVNAPSHCVLEDLTVTKDITATKVTVGGKTTCDNNLNINGDVDCSGDVTLSNTLHVSGGDFAISGNGTAGELTLPSVSLSGDVTVSRATVTRDMNITEGFASNGVFSAQLADVDGELTAPNSGLEISGGLTVTNVLTAGGLLSASGTMSVQNELRCSEALLVGSHLNAALGGGPVPVVSSSTIYDKDGVIDTGVAVTVGAGSTDNVGTVFILATDLGTKTAWRLSTISITFGTPFEAPPFIVLSVDQPGIGAGQGWGETDAPPVLWVTDVTTTGFTIFFADLGVTYALGAGAFIRFLAVGPVV